MGGSISAQITRFTSTNFVNSYALGKKEQHQWAIPIHDGQSAKNTVDFYFYARNNGAPVWIRFCTEFLEDWKTQWRSDKEVFILVHGFSNGLESDFPRLTGQALGDTTNFNIIAVDYKRWSTFKTPFSYLRAVIRAPAVGVQIAKFIKKLEFQFNAQSEQISLVAYSLGCHVSHFAAKHSSQQSLYKAIFALDPAGPLFRLRKDRLSPVDASSVLVVHTNGGPWYRPDRLGILDACGTTDIYVNGGQRQPGYGAIKSHSMAYHIFISSIKNPMVAIGVGNTRVELGLNVSEMARGVFHLNI